MGADGLLAERYRREEVLPTPQAARQASGLSRRLLCLPEKPWFEHSPALPALKRASHCFRDAPDAAFARVFSSPRRFVAAICRLFSTPASGGLPSGTRLLYPKGTYFIAIFRNNGIMVGDTMRYSLLYPSQRQAVQTGIIALGIVAFLAGTLLLVVPTGKATKSSIAIRLSLQGLDDYAPVQGPVYWLDANSGRATVIGKYDIGYNINSMAVRVPPEHLSGDKHVSALFWPGRARSFVPHMNFLFNAEMRQRLDQKAGEIGKDDMVQRRADEASRILIGMLSDRIEPEIANLAADQEFRAAIIRAGIDVAVSNMPNWIERLRRDKSGQDTDRMDSNESIRAIDGTGRDSEVSWSELIEIVREHITSWDWTRWSREIRHDPAFKDAMDALIVELEPHLKSALDEILWVDPDTHGFEMPNARLIWVARRMLLGGRSSAVLLFESDDGVLFSSGAVIVGEVAR